MVYRLLERLEVNFMNKKTYAVILVICISFTLQPLCFAILNPQADLLISTPEQFAQFRDSVNNGNTYKGKTIALTADIDLGGGISNYWDPIGTEKENYFCGTFDGEGHTISGIYVKDNNMNALFTGLGEYGTIKNLFAKGVVFASITQTNKSSGGIVAENYGTIENCVSNISITAITQLPNIYVGGIAGTNYGVIKTSCQVNTIFNTYAINTIGGIVGINSGSGTVTDCFYISTKCLGCNSIPGTLGVTNEQMSSGEVAFMLYEAQNITSDYNGLFWGQDLAAQPQETLPKLTTDKSNILYQVTYMSKNSKYASSYANYGSVTALPPDPVYEDGALAYWTTDSQILQNPPPVPQAVFDKNTPVTENITVYAVLGRQFREKSDAVKIIAARAQHTVNFDLKDMVEFINPDYSVDLLTFSAKETLPSEISLDGSSVTWAPTQETPNQTEFTFSVTDKNPYIPSLFDSESQSAIGTMDLTILFVSTPDLTQYLEPDDSDPKGNTYFIQDTDDLIMLQTAVNSGVPSIGLSFKQTSDIALGCTLEKPWDPIGDYDCKFQALYDGGGYTVWDIYIDGNFWCGLFGYLGENGIIKNLSTKGTIKNIVGNSGVGGIAGWSRGIIENCQNYCDVTSTNGNCGGIAGFNENGDIIGCSNAGNISSFGANAGGIAGNSQYGNIINCRNSGNVICDNYILAGGIAGTVNHGTIENCSNTGNISASNQAGGIAGYSYCASVSCCYNTGNIKGVSYTGGICGNYQGDKDNYINNSYNTGSISGDEYMGGIIGYGFGYSQINNCYNFGTLINTNSQPDNIKNHIGSIAGILDLECTINNCFFNKDVFDENNSSGIQGIAEIDFSNPNIFIQAGWDFDNIWDIGTFIARPVLRSVPEGGNGSEEFPYIIPDLETLEDFCNTVNNGNDYENQYIKLTNDIDLKSDESDQWTPIGLNNTVPFSGIFDGNGKKISGIYIDSTNPYQGFFGYISNTGIVKNLGIKGTVNGSSYAGSVSGINYGIISGCYSETAVNGNNNIGGITGENNGVIENCYNTGSVSGSENIGGITGCDIASARISNCYNIGSVSGSSNIGENIGSCLGTIENCYFLSENQTASSNKGETPKTSAQFASGEVAFLLRSANIQSPIWGQNILNEPKDKFPLLTDDLYKQVYKVTFLLRNTEYALAYANFNGTVELPPTPSNNMFVKWCLTYNPDDDAFTSNSPITKDLNVYAIISNPGIGPEQYFTVEFDSQGGSIVNSIKVISTGTISEPSAPVKEGFVFEGWYTDQNCTEIFDFNTKIMRNLTLYAKWSEDENSGQIDTPDDWENPFIDVNEPDWFYESVKYVNINGLFVGTSENTFSPNAPITRGMIVTVLWRAENKPVVNYLMPFDDVDEWAYYSEAIRWAASEQIVKGYSNTEFGPDDSITREQIAAIMRRYAGYKGLDISATGDILQFADEQNISGWAKEDVSWAVGTELLLGKENKILDPLGNTTRAETAAVLQRFLPSILKNQI